MAVEEGSPWLQVITVAGLLTFTGYGMGAASWRMRASRGRCPPWRPARWLATTGLLSVVGLSGYLVYLASTGARSLGVLVIGRPIPCLLLQFLALGVVAATVATVVAAWRARFGSHRSTPGTHRRADSPVGWCSCRGRCPRACSCRRAAASGQRRTDRRVGAPLPHIGVKVPIVAQNSWVSRAILPGDTRNRAHTLVRCVPKEPSPSRSHAGE